MLDRERIRNIMVGKYLMFIPMAALLLLFSNCTSRRADKVQSDTEKADIIIAAGPDKTAEPQIEVVITEAKGDSIYSVVKTVPGFPGGQKELLSFLSRNIKYPTKTIENKIQGRVIVRFVANKNGSISGAKVVRSVDPGLDKKALRVVSSMPQWRPGMNKEEIVDVKYTIPVMLKLQ